MIFNAFQREDDDAVFTIVRNVSGAARASGDAVVWDISASVDGVRVTVPAAATLSLFRGVLVEAIANSAYGKCQIHGYNSAAAVINQITTPTAAGDILIPVTTKDYVVRSGASDGKSGFVYAAAAIATNATPAETTAKVLIRAM